MGYTIESEYKRLQKLQDKKPLTFEYGGANGTITELRYLARDFCKKAEIQVFGNAGFDYLKDNPKPRILFTITEEDVSKRYDKRSYRYLKEYHTIAYYGN